MVPFGLRALWSHRRRWLGACALGLYATIASMSPALHHDLACHVKSPAHCDACAANPLASRVEARAGLEAPPLLAAGESPSDEEHPEQGAPTAPTSGRSPPA